MQSQWKWLRSHLKISASFDARWIVPQLRDFETTSHALHIMMNTTEPFQIFADILRNHNVEHYGWTSLERPISIENYRTWIQEERHAEMTYLKDHMACKETPQSYFSPMQSLLVIGQNYHPVEEPLQIPLKNLRIAKYAQNKDYHHWFKDRLQKLILDFKTAFPEGDFLSFTDAVPLLERDYAAQAGLGWIGKNSCVIHPKRGSLFFLGEILCSLPVSNFPQKKMIQDHCGKCSRCIDICPTEAILPNRTLEAHRCISYLTIESKKIAPPNLRSSIGPWFFGCDLCQTVCPWNQKAFGPDIHREPELQSENLEAELRWILASSNKALFKTLKESALVRAGAKGLKRNALYQVAHFHLTSLIPEVKALTNHPQLGVLASETLVLLERKKT